MCVCVCVLSEIFLVTKLSLVPLKTFHDGAFYLLYIIIYIFVLIISIKIEQAYNLVSPHISILNKK